VLLAGNGETEANTALCVLAVKVADLRSGFPRGPGVAPQRMPSPRWSGQATKRL